MKRVYNIKEAVEIVKVMENENVANGFIFEEDAKEYVASFESALESIGEFEELLIFETDEIEDEEFGMVKINGKWEEVYLAGNNGQIELVLL